MFGTSAVETKGIFVQVPLKMLSRHSALVGCAQPAFEQGRNQVNMREVFEGTFRITKQRPHPMPVSGLADTVVPVPIVGTDLHSLTANSPSAGPGASDPLQSLA